MSLPWRGCDSEVNRAGSALRCAVPARLMPVPAGFGCGLHPGRVLLGPYHQMWRAHGDLLLTAWAAVLLPGGRTGDAPDQEVAVGRPIGFPATERCALSGSGRAAASVVVPLAAQGTV